jgi:hypothetical protein
MSESDLIPPRSAWITAIGWIHCLIGFAACVSPLVAVDLYRGELSTPPLPLYVTAVGGGVIEAAGVTILLRRRSALWLAPIGAAWFLAGLTWLLYPAIADGDWLESPSIEWLVAILFFGASHFLLRARSKEFVADRLLDEEAPE